MKIALHKSGGEQ